MRTAESILNALTGPVLLLDESLCAVRANPAFYQTLEIAPAALAGTKIQDLLQTGPAEGALTNALSAVTTHNTPVDGLQLECKISGGAKITLLLTARRVHTDASKQDLILLELRNVTSQRATERLLKSLSDAHAKRGTMLELANRELEAFTHSASHDLKTPLRLTNKICHLLMEEHANELTPKARDKVEMILKSTEEMGNLIEGLLRLSQVTREPIKVQKVDVVRLVSQVCHDLEEELRGRDVKLSIGALPACLADQSLLRQIYTNLITNALKFTRTREHAEISIGATEHNGTTAYFVRDNGVGIDMANAEIIFLAFHRIHQVPSVEGSGLGLALVRRIVERHGGHAWAEGAPNQGTTIYFTLTA